MDPVLPHLSATPPTTYRPRLSVCPSARLGPINSDSPSAPASRMAFMNLDTWHGPGPGWMMMMMMMMVSVDEDMEKRESL